MFMGHFKTFSVARRCRDNLLKTSKIFKANSFQLCTPFWVNFATMFILKQNTFHFPIAILSLVTYKSLLSNISATQTLTPVFHLLWIPGLFSWSMHWGKSFISFIPILPNEFLFTADYFLHQIPALVSCPRSCLSFEGKPFVWSPCVGCTKQPTWATLSNIKQITKIDFISSLLKHNKLARLETTTHTESDG